MVLGSIEVSPKAPQSKGDGFTVGAKIVLSNSLLSQKKTVRVACYWLSIPTLDAKLAILLSGLQRQIRRSYFLVEW